MQALGREKQPSVQRLHPQNGKVVIADDINPRACGGLARPAHVDRHLSIGHHTGKRLCHFLVFRIGAFDRIAKIDEVGIGERKRKLEFGALLGDDDEFLRVLRRQRPEEEIVDE